MITKKDRKVAAPRTANYYGMRCTPSYGTLGTWCEPEEITYPSGAMIRRCRAIDANTGRRRVVRCGIADTFYSLPVRGGGWVGMESGAYVYHAPNN